MVALVLVRNMLFAFCESGRFFLLLWSMLFAYLEKVKDEEKEKE